MDCDHCGDLRYIYSKYAVGMKDGTRKEDKKIIINYKTMDMFVATRPVHRPMR